MGIIRWTGHDKDNPYNKFTAAAITGSADDPGNSSGRIDFGVAYSDTMIDAMTIRAHRVMQELVLVQNAPSKLFMSRSQLVVIS